MPYYFYISLTLSHLSPNILTKARATHRATDRALQALQTKAAGHQNGHTDQ